MLGVSSDSILTHDLWAQRESLPFGLLADTEGVLRELLGVRDSLFGLLPARVTFVIDQDGRIRGRFRSQIRIPRHATYAIEVLEKLPRAVRRRKPVPVVS